MEFDFGSPDFLLEFVNVGIIGFFLGMTVFENDVGVVEELCLPSGNHDGMEGCVKL
jgi:hypothetical protein